MLNPILGIILVFGALIFFHELGHFVFAKRAGILCREFAIGMGPKLFSFKKGETLYTLRLLPIGGFVRMAGEDPEVVELKTGQEVALLFDAQQRVTRIVVKGKEKYPQARLARIEDYDLEKELVVRVTEAGVDGSVTYQVHPQAYLVFDGQEVQIAPLDRQFGGKTLGQRFITIFAGPAANILLAFILLTSTGLIYGLPLDDPKLGRVMPDGPAAEAGLQQGDLVKTINGEPVTSFQEIREIVKASPNQPLRFEIEREGQPMTYIVVPEVVENEATGKTESKMMVYQATYFSIPDSIARGATETVNFTLIIFKSLGMLISGDATVNDLSGPVGIFTMTGDAAERGFQVLLTWGAILSINLAIFNMLPIPALDGGRLVFLGIEALRGKPIDPHKEGMVHFLGFAFLMLLILFVTWNDIQKFIING